MKKTLLLLALLALLPRAALTEDEQLFCVRDEAGGALFSRMGSVSVGDEYIAGNNALYRIVSVTPGEAVASHVGEEPMPDVSWLDAGAAQAVFSPLQASVDHAVPAAAKGGKDSVNHKKRLIAMYVTHSDESYIPSDGTQSIEGQGGIYDVARALRDELQKKGVDVILDESTHLPHDSGAYRRSRRTAERLLQKRPDAIIDIHRDGIPDPDEYAATIGGEKASQVRLLVGRGNQNSSVNREFAKQIKAVADRKYPGLIKDIFIGKGNYNQDLSPNAILLEFGTHTLSKERALESTDVMADVLSTTLYGETTASVKSDAPAPAEKEKKDTGALSSIALLLALLVVGVILFALVQTGGGRAMGRKLGRNVSEMTGGLLGKKREKK